MSDQLFQTLILPENVLSIRAENLFQFDALGAENTTVENQLKIIAWNRAGPNIQKLRDISRVKLYWQGSGVLAIIYKEKQE